MPSLKNILTLFMITEAHTNFEVYQRLHDEVANQDSEIKICIAKCSPENEEEEDNNMEIVHRRLACHIS